MSKLRIVKVYCPISAFGEGLLDSLLDALRPEGANYHFTPMFLLKPQSFFEGIRIGFVYMKADIFFLNPAFWFI